MSPQPPPHLGREQGSRSPHPASSGSRDRAHPTFRRQSHKATPGLSPLQRVFPVSRSCRILLSSHPPDRAHFKPIPSQPPDPGGAGSSTARERSGVTGRRKFCGVFLQGFGSLQRRLDPPAAAASHWSPSWSHRWAAPSKGLLHLQPACDHAQRCIASPTPTDTLFRRKSDFIQPFPVI